jgi:O-antigen/teichoic acid export membrane protein
MGVNQKEVKTRSLSSFIWKLLERFCAQGVTLIVSIILARLLEPKDYAAISVVTIFFTFANVFVSGGLNTALMQKKDPDPLDYSTILYSTLFVSIIIYVILFFSSPFIAKIYNIDSLTLIIRVMGVVLPINAVKSIWCAYISSQLMFRKFFFATIVGTVISAIVGIVMAYKGCGPWALVVQQMLNIIIDTIILVITTKIKLLFQFSGKRFFNLFKFGSKVMLASFIDVAYLQFSPLIIGVRFSTTDLAFYNKGQTFPSALSSSTTSSLSAVMFPVVAKFQDNKGKVLYLTRKFMQVASFVVFPLMIGLFSISDNFIIVLLTEKWLPASYYLKLFCLQCMFSIVAIGNCETIKAIGKSGVYLKMEIIKKILYFIVLFLFVFFSPSVQIFATSLLFIIVIQLIVNSIPNSKLINYSYKKQISDIGVSFLISCIMGCVVYLIGYLSPEHSVEILIRQIVVGGFIYFLLSFLFNRKIIIYILGLVKSLGGNKHE